MADEMSRALTAEMKRRGAGAQKVVAGMSAELARLRSELERVKGESASNADHARIANANFRAMDKARAINLARAEAAEARIAGLERALARIADLDDVEAMLDPTWAKREALATLRALQKGGGHV